MYEITSDLAARVLVEEQGEGLGLQEVRGRGGGFYQPINFGSGDLRSPPHYRDPGVHTSLHMLLSV